MKRLSGPIDVQLELTEKCNFKCRHCYNYWRYGEKSRERELSTAHFLRIIRTLKNYGVSVITLTGGEPLLRTDVLFALLKEAKRCGMEVGLNSNATLITQDIAKHLRNEGLDHALCSVLGKETTHNFITGASNGFSQTTRGIENLVKTGLVVATNMVVSKLNRNEVFGVGRIAKDLGVKTFCATPMVPSHESNRSCILSGSECKQALRDLLEVKKIFGINVDTLEPIARCLFDEAEEDDFIFFFGNRICSAAVTSCAISSSGMVRPCIHSDKSFGNILREDFSSIWAKMTPWSEESMLPIECANCTATSICEGGCRMSSKTLHGCYDGKDMYMSEPIHEKTRVAKLPVRKKQDTKITLGEKVKINPLVRSREESFGGIVYIGTNVEFLTQAGLRVIQLMVRKEVFSLAEIAVEVSLTDGDILEIALKLLDNNIILTKERR